MGEVNLVGSEVSRHSEIRLMLDDYSDIFSDFDPRPYAEKALSTDFIDETKRASIDKEFGNIYLRLIIPKKKKSESIEEVVKKRLHSHFNKHHEILHKESKKIVKNGFYFTFFGVILMFLASYVLFMNHKTFLTSFFIILLEPAGWFSFWEGLNLMIFDSKKNKSDREFYHKMAKSQIEFVSY